MRRRWLWGRILLMSAAALLTWKGLSLYFGTGEAEQLLKRAWFERAPEEPRERVQAVIFIEDDGERFGAVSFSSMYRLRFDFFSWTLERERLTLELLQDDRFARYDVKVRECDDAPEGFDLCLDIEGEGEKCRFYSNSGWDQHTHAIPRPQQLAKVDSEEHGGEARGKQTSLCGKHRGSW